MEINQPAPDFELPDLHGHVHKLSDSLGRIVILNFWSAECQHSERTDRLIVKYLAEWGGTVELLSIAPNRNESAQLVEQAGRARSLPAVLIDADHMVADLFEAIVTPHIFVVDEEGILRYRGSVDDVAFRRTEPMSLYLKDAVDDLLAGHLPDVPDTPAYGCALVREI